MSYPLYYAFDGAAPPPRTGAAHATIYPYGPFPAGDGKHRDARPAERARVGSVLRQGAASSPSSPSDPRFAATPSACAARDALRAIIVEAFARADRRAGRRAARRGADRQRAGQHDARRLGASAAEGARPLARSRHARRARAGAAAARQPGTTAAAHGPGAGARRSTPTPSSPSSATTPRAIARAAQRRGASDRMHAARTYLFVPGNRPERFDKALASGADAVVARPRGRGARRRQGAARATRSRDWLRRAGEHRARRGAHQRRRDAVVR